MIIHHTNSASTAEIILAVLEHRPHERRKPEGRWQMWALIAAGYALGILTGMIIWRMQ